MRSSSFRRIACVLALVVAWTMTGCGGDSDKSPKAEQGSKPPPDAKAPGSKGGPKITPE